MINKKILLTVKIIASIASIILLFVGSAAYATKNTLQLQIIKEQLTLTKQSFKRVRFMGCSHKTCAVQVELISKVANDLQRLTAANLNHQINLVWQDHIMSAPIIRSALGANFVMTGFTKEQAISFVKEMG